METGQIVTATGSASDSDGIIAGATIDWGDGAATAGLSGTHAYSVAGPYTVRLTVTDDDGATAFAEASITVTTPAARPVAAFTASTATPNVGDIVSFDARGSSDADGTIVSYVWDFGDGTGDSGAEVSHAYGAAGG